ncbi:MAG: GAF domain-containing protein [Solirubrobacterales bacterium]
MSRADLDAVPNDGSTRPGATSQIHGRSECVKPSTAAGDIPPIEIAPDDPIIAHCQEAAGAVELEHLSLDSPALAEMRTSGVTLVVPLVSNGEPIGLLSVGRRLSDQDHSADDRRLLETLAGHAAPVVRVGQLIREQRAETQARGRLEQELAVARLIQQSFLPKQLPDLAGWQIAAYYRRPTRSAATSTTSSSCRMAGSGW